MEVIKLIKNYLNKSDLIKLKLVNKKFYNFVVNYGDNLYTKSTNLIKHHYIDSFKYLFEENSILELYVDPLFATAAEHGFINLCKWLVKRGADVSYFGNLAFELAAENGHLDVVKWLIQFKPELNVALSAATNGGHIDMCKYLVSRGATFDDDLFELALKKGYTRICEWAIANELVDCGYAVYLI